MIYFVQAVDGGLIKIGYTAWVVANRLQAIQHGSPVPLVCLAAADGEIQDEFELHAHFADARVYSEWFRPVPELLDLIAEIRKVPGEWTDYRLTFQPRKNHRGTPGAALEWRQLLALRHTPWSMEAP